MILGIGIDITEISRIKNAFKAHNTFAQRVLTSAELVAFNKYGEKRKYEFLAGRFSAKESYSKAAGTGIGKIIGFQDIEIIDDQQTGRPRIMTHPFIEDEAHISISHTEKVVITEVILESKS
ncbi:holo-ACP synthase [Liquorilactobacillus oeni]|uniref:Holo-[acyl-carrier-protein] synthase n=1 Tax=Liquorilactobacillus oeni DSM 19972 TaxID=1423777 RepID=A0A0R1MDI0_9LACO|nr:holo-ACP synthase [Liquorilactobacillus oeni]KRL06231.1 hypothetical protein FD46_GL000233 [Liquorilactobacillus oeni DSM 19972]